MAQGNQFLQLPEQRALFRTIQTGEQRDDATLDYEDEEEPEEDARLIPRCSPIPRKRGSSIADETAEYLRMRLALSRRVAFADAAGEDLVHVREFVAFDSDEDEDEEEGGGGWEEEEAQLRRTHLEPVYSVWPEFPARADGDLMHAVRANKVEVERVSCVPEQPRAFDALICVWNVCYHKRVSVRFTTDGWLHQAELPARYLHSDLDQRTDRFSARLAFSEPFLFNGARIDFVVRYETSDGEFWANNSGRNYSVTLLVSFEDKNLPKTEDREVRGILKPPRCRMGNDYDLPQENNEGDMASAERETECEECFQTICPLVIEPEIDIELIEASART